MIRRDVILLMVALAVFSGSALAQASDPSSVGGAAGSPFRLGYGARGMGMGNAMSAVIWGDVTAYYNPAVVPFQPMPVAGASFGILSFDRNLNTLSFTQGLKPTGGVSVGLVNAGVSGIDGRNRDGIVTEEYATSENLFYLSFGLKPEDGFAMGISAKILYHKLFADVTSSTVGIDVGILVHLAEGVQGAVVFQDIGGKYKWDTSRLYGRDGNATTDRFPLRRRFSVSVHPAEAPWLAAAELEWIGSALFTRVGGEFMLTESFTVRAGLDQYSPVGLVDAKPSFGASFRTPVGPWQPSLDYAYVLEPYGTGGMHIVALLVRFE